MSQITESKESNWKESSWDEFLNSNWSNFISSSSDGKETYFQITRSDVLMNLSVTADSDDRKAWVCYNMAQLLKKHKNYNYTINLLSLNKAIKKYYAGYKRAVNRYYDGEDRWHKK